MCPLFSLGVILLVLPVAAARECLLWPPALCALTVPSGKSLRGGDCGSSFSREACVVRRQAVALRSGCTLHSVARGVCASMHRRHDGAASVPWASTATSCCRTVCAISASCTGHSALAAELLGWPGRGPWMAQQVCTAPRSGPYSAPFTLDPRSPVTLLANVEADLACSWNQRNLVPKTKGLRDLLM